MENTPTKRQLARLDKIRRVTENFFFWQGYRLVPMALPLLAFPAATQLGLADDTRTGVFIAATVVAMALFSLIGRFYAAHYGDVADDAPRHARRAAIKWYAVYPVMIGAIIADLTLDPPFFLTGPVWAIATLLYRASTGGGRAHYFVVAGLYALMAFFPYVGVTETDDMIQLFLAASGIFYSVAGVLDHNEMRRTLRGEKEGST